MKYIKFFLHNGYCGCNTTDVILMRDDVTDEEINDCIYTMALEHAETYSYVAFGLGVEPSEKEYEAYLENVDWGYEVITREQYIKFCRDYGRTPKDE